MTTQIGHGSYDQGQYISQALLSWYDEQKRSLPWRQTKNPYYIWLSEIMLQQTQAQTVIPYYNHFISRWPTLKRLASASELDVLKAWEGLGYYSRARNILKSAHIITEQYKGVFPQTYAEIIALPGIGEYTAGALMSIAFNQPYPAVDGNVVRVGARLSMSAWSNQRLSDKKQVREWISKIIPTTRCGDFNEALMDLGATVCLPNQPRCAACPLTSFCLAYLNGKTSDYPIRIKKEKAREEQHIVLLLTKDNQVYVEKKQGHGLLAGLYQFSWLKQTDFADDNNNRKLLEQIYQPADIISLGTHHHIFTHLKWQLEGFVIIQPRTHLPAPGQGCWVGPEQLRNLPVSNALNVFRQRWLALAESEFIT